MFRPQLRQQPLFVVRQLLRGSDILIAPGDAAPGLHRAGFRHVCGIHHQPRRHLEGVKSGIRLLYHLAGNAQRGVAHVDGVAGFQIQQRH